MQRNKGVVKRSRNGYVGRINIDNVEFDVNCTFWSDRKPAYIWVQRNKEKRFHAPTKSFFDYTPKPTFECIADKVGRGGVYKGQFMFVGFKYDLTAWWEDKQETILNFDIQRCEEQPIIKRLNEINRESLQVKK